MFVEWILSGFVGMIIGVIFQPPLQKILSTVWRALQKNYYTHRKDKDIAVGSEFSFGKKQTCVIIIDGDGREEYRSGNIRADIRSTLQIDSEYKDTCSYFIERTNNEMNRKKAAGEPVPWNGKTLSLQDYYISRSDTGENMLIKLGLAMNDYYTT